MLSIFFLLVSSLFLRHDENEELANEQHSVVILGEWDASIFPSTESLYRPHVFMPSAAAS